MTECRAICALRPAQGPRLGLRETERRFSPAVVFVRIEMEDALPGARQGASWRTSVS